MCLRVVMCVHVWVGGQVGEWVGEWTRMCSCMCACARARAARSIQRQVGTVAGTSASGRARLHRARPRCAAHSGDMVLQSISSGGCSDSALRIPSGPGGGVGRRRARRARGGGVATVQGAGGGPGKEKARRARGGGARALCRSAHGWRAYCTCVTAMSDMRDSCRPREVLTLKRVPHVLRGRQHGENHRHTCRGGWGYMDQGGENVFAGRGAARQQP